MKPEERAEKIERWLNTGPGIDAVDVREHIAAEIREAVEEAVKSDTTMSLFVHKRLVSEAKREGFELAKQEAIEWCMAFRRDDGTSQAIEEKIRALQMPEEK